MKRPKKAWKQGKHAEALGRYVEALEMERAACGQGACSDSIATSLQNVGVSWMDLNNHDEAKKFLLEALEMYRSVSGQKKHLDVAHVLKLLGKNSSDHGDFRSAKEFLDEAGLR